MLSKRDTYLYYLILQRKILQKNQLDRAILMFKKALSTGLKVDFGFILQNQGYLNPQVVQRLYQMVDQMKGDPSSSEINPPSEDNTAHHQDLGIQQTKTLQNPSTTTLEAALGMNDPEERKIHVGQRIGDYEILSELGRGGMGVVYKALQLSLKREVALKMLSQGMSLHKEAVERFWREARAVAKLQHPSIVQVYSAHNEQGFYFYAMEFVRGKSLDAILKERRLTIKEAVNFMIQACEAMEYAHSFGIVHRDIKPSNMLITEEGKLLVTDFGLVREMGEEGDRLTISGAILGTPAYMSPEQAMGDSAGLDHLTDIYSLGATFYEFVSRRPPFTGETSHNVLYKIITEDPPSLKRARAAIPQDIETIIFKAMRREKEKRYPSAEAFAEDLRLFQQGLPIQARPMPWWEKGLHKIKRNKLTVTVVSALLLVMGIWFFYQSAYSSVEKEKTKEHTQRVKAEKEKEKEKLAKEEEKLAKEREIAKKIFETEKKDLLKTVSGALLLAQQAPEEAQKRFLACLEKLKKLSPSFGRYSSPQEGEKEKLNDYFKIYKGLATAFESWALQSKKRASEGLARRDYPYYKSHAQKELFCWKEAEKWVSQLKEVLSPQLDFKAEEFQRWERDILMKRALYREEQGHLKWALQDLEELAKKYPQFTEGALEKKKTLALLANQKKDFAGVYRIVQSVFREYGKVLGEEDYKALSGYFYFLRARALLLQGRILYLSEGRYSVRLGLERFSIVKRAVLDLNSALGRNSKLVEARFIRGLLRYYYPSIYYYHQEVPPFPRGSQGGILFNYRGALGDFYQSSFYLEDPKQRERALFYGVRCLSRIFSFWQNHLLDAESSFWDSAEVTSFQNFPMNQQMFLFPGQNKKWEPFLVPFLRCHALIDSRRHLAWLSTNIGLYKGNRNLLKASQRKLFRGAFNALESLRKEDYYKILQGEEPQNLSSKEFYLFQGRRYIEKGLYPKAEKAFQNALVREPKSLLGLDGLLRACSLATGKNSEISGLLDRIPSKLTTRIPLVYSLALAYEALGNHKKSLTLRFQALSEESSLSQDFRSDGVYFYLYGLEALKKAEGLQITLANVQDPQYKTWIYFLWNGAEFFSRALEEIPKFALAHYYRGLVYLYLGRWNAAKRDLMAAVKTNPNLLSAYALLALLEGHFQAQYEKGLEFFQGGVGALKNLLGLLSKGTFRPGWIEEQIGSFFFYYKFYLENTYGLLSKEAREAAGSHPMHRRIFSGALQKTLPLLSGPSQKALAEIDQQWNHPRFSGAPAVFPFFLKGVHFTYMGQRFQRAARMDEVIQATHLARSHIPASPFVYAYLGEAYYKSKPFPMNLALGKEIILNFARAVEIEPRYGYVIYDQIQRLEKVRPYVKMFAGQMIGSLQKFQKQYPKEASADFLYGFYYYLEGNMEKVRKHILRSIDLNPKLTVFGHALLGRLYYEKKDYRRAEGALKRSLEGFQEFYPTEGIYGLSAFWLGVLYAKQKKFPLSVQYLKKALEGGFSRQHLQKDLALKELRNYPGAADLFE